MVYHGTLNQADVSYLLDCLAGEDIKPLFVDPPGSMATGVLVAVSRDYCRTLVEEHMAILEKRGGVVFGKFRFQRKAVGGTSLGLEAMGRESFEGNDVGAFAECVRADLSSGRDVSLFIRDPEPPGRLWRAKIEQIDFNAAGRGDSLPRPRSSFAPPQFPGVQDVKELIPPYYFLDQSRENLGFHCNFWFLVSSWEPVEPASVPFCSRTNSHKIVYSTQVLYPAAIMYDPAGVHRLAADDAAGSDVFPALGPELRRTIETVFAAFSTVRFTPAAIREFAGGPDDFKKQAVKRLLKVEMSEASQEVLKVISSPVVSASDLREFKLTGNGGGGRLAAGLLGRKLVVVGMDSQHRSPTAFWNEMARRWSDEKDRDSASK
ncbi:MAG: hypothetical protein ABFD84_14515 [Candidatus Polarisedimenticolia bacterium]